MVSFVHRVHRMGWKPIIIFLPTSLKIFFFRSDEFPVCTCSIGPIGYGRYSLKKNLEMSIPKYQLEILYSIFFCNYVPATGCYGDNFKSIKSRVRKRETRHLIWFEFLWDIHEPWDRFEKRMCRMSIGPRIPWNYKFSIWSFDWNLILRIWMLLNKHEIIFVSQTKCLQISNNNNNHSFINEKRNILLMFGNPRETSTPFVKLIFQSFSRPLNVNDILNISI